MEFYVSAILEIKTPQKYCRHFDAVVVLQLLRQWRSRTEEFSRGADVDMTSEDVENETSMMSMMEIEWSNRRSSRLWNMRNVVINIKTILCIDLGTLPRAV